METGNHIIVLGISNVGKTETGKRVAEKLHYAFYDIDQEVKDRLHTTIAAFSQQNSRKQRDKIRAEITKELVSRKENSVISLPAVRHMDYFKPVFRTEHVSSVTIQDDPVNIFTRLVFPDEADQLLEDEDYKNRYRDYYLQELARDILYYERSFLHSDIHLYLHGQGIEEAADALIDKYTYWKNRRAKETYRCLMIRPVRLDDSFALYLLNTRELKCDFDYLQNLRQLKDALDADRSEILIAQVDDEVAGYIQLERSYCLSEVPTLDILALAVGERYQRRGIASSLMRRAEQSARLLGMERLRFRLDESWKKGEKFLKACGFQESARPLVYIRKMEYPEALLPD